MKGRKLLSAIIAIAMMTASSVGVTAFAEEGTTAILDTSESQTEATSETSVSDEDAVAKIGDENYASLQSAIKNATSGQTTSGTTSSLNSSTTSSNATQSNNETISSGGSFFQDKGTK